MMTVQKNGKVHYDKYLMKITRILFTKKVKVIITFYCRAASRTLNKLSFADLKFMFGLSPDTT